MSPALMALLRNKHEFSAEVFKGSLTYSNLKAVLNSKEVSAFVNNKAYQQLAASLVSAIDGAFSSLYSTLSETAKGGVLRTLQAVAYVAEGSPVVTVFTGEMTIRDYQSILRTQLDIHGKSPLTMQTEEVGGALRSTRVGHWLQVTDPVVLEQRIQVRLTAPLSNQGKISGITMLTPEVIDPLSEDNNIRGNSTLADYARLRPAFDRKHGSVTAANSTPLTDGAAAVILMTESRAKELGLVPLGYLRSYAFTAIDVWQDMLLGPAWSTPLALERAGITMADLTLFDMHEAFAAQTLANLQLLGSERFAREVLGRSHATGEVDDSKFNVLGGSIAYGHPFAATGARMITQTLHELRRRGGGFGLVTACAAGGLGAAMVLEAE